MKKNYSHGNLAMVKASKNIFTNIGQFLSQFYAVNLRYTEEFVAQMIAIILSMFAVIGIEEDADNSLKRAALVAYKIKFKNTLSTVLNSAKTSFCLDPEKYNLLVRPLDLALFIKSGSDEAIMELALRVLGSLDTMSPLYNEALIPAALLNELRQSALDYKESFVNQNEGAGRSVAVSDENQEILNNIYTEALRVSGIAQHIFKGDKEKLKLFSFSAIAKTYKSSRRKKAKLSPDTTPEQTEQLAQLITQAIQPVIEEKIESYEFNG